MSAEQVRAVLADHFVMHFKRRDDGVASFEWRCACGMKFGFSDSALDHVAAEVIAVISDGAK